MKYIDIHTHTYYSDPETTLVLNIFPNELDKLEHTDYCSIGLHPWHVEEDTWETQVSRVKSAARNKKVLAVGETGLDKKTDRPFETQQLAFLAQLVIAESEKKPLILHCVRSYSEMLSYRKRSDLSIPWIFHWFNADSHIAEALIRKNCYLSFGHMLFREESKAFRIFNTIPLDRVFFETDDAGFSIGEIYAQAAGLRNIKVSGLKSRILDNFSRCFQL
jgi:TatD DNase family protein